MQHLCGFDNMIVSPEGARVTKLPRGIQSFGNTTEMLHLFHYTKQHSTQFCDILLPYFLKAAFLMG